MVIRIEDVIIVFEERAVLRGGTLPRIHTPHPLARGATVATGGWHGLPYPSNKHAQGSTIYFYVHVLNLLHWGMVYPILVTAGKHSTL